MTKSTITLPHWFIWGPFVTTLIFLFGKLTGAPVSWLFVLSPLLILPATIGLLVIYLILSYSTNN